MGKAKMRIYRLPRISSTGDRRGWETMDPRVVRELAMIPTALEVGISIQHSTPALSSPLLQRWLPSRCNAKESGICTTEGKPAQLGIHQVYVGRGHHAHRLATTKWSCPFLAGKDGTHEECMMWYIQHLHYGPLWCQLEELYGKTLVCDCPMGQGCEADVLIAECFWKLMCKKGMKN